MAYPSDLDSFENPVGTNTLSSPDHAGLHRGVGSAVMALEAKVGVSSGSPVLNKLLVGSGNGTTAWGTTVNNLNLGTPTIGTPTIVGGSWGTPSITGGTITSATFVSASGVASPFVTVGTSGADYTTDGTADDVQIQAAIDAVTALGGGIVYLKAGTYNISNNNASPAFIQSDTGSPYCGVILKDKVVLQGAGPGKTIITYSAFVGTALGQNMNPIVNSAGSQTYQGIMDMSIINPAFTINSGPYARSIHVKGVSNFIMKNLYLYKGGWAIMGNTYSFNGTTKELTTDAQYNLVDNVISDTFKDSCFIFNAKNTTVRNSTFLTAYDDDLLIAQSAHNILVDGNTFDGGNAGTGAVTAHIYVYNDDAVSTDEQAIKDVKIINNTIKRINSATGFSAGIDILKASNVVIENNLIDGNRGPGIYNSGLGPNRDLKIRGNTIKNNGDAGIKLPVNVGTSNPSLFNVNISNNAIYNNTTYGMYFETASNTGTADDMMIANNSIFDNQGTVTQGIGISIHASSKNFTNVYMDMNSVRNAGTAYDLVGGTLIGLSNLFVSAGTLRYTGTAATSTTIANP